MKHKYLVGYAGEGHAVFGNNDQYYAPYAEPMTLKEALERSKTFTFTRYRVRLYKLVVVREWKNGPAKQ